MKKIICWIFGHRVDIEKNQRPAIFFSEKSPEWIIKCERCGYKENILNHE